MPITVLGGTKVADTAYEIANSCRWNDGDSMKMTRTPSGDGNLDVWTYSTWIKLGNIGVEYVVFHTYGASGTTETFVKILSGGAIEFSLRVSGTYEGQLITNRLFRDPSAWYHLCFVMNTGNATSGDRMILYVNGVRETSFSTETYPDQNQDSTINDASFEHTIGSYGSGNYFDGYMAEVVFLDGTAAAITDLGEFDSDSPTIWKPVDPSGLTFGTNGFWLDFEDSSNLGNDKNGGADWTEVNFAAADQAVDSPTNNWCVVNPLDNYYAGATLSEGNCLVAHPAAKYNYITSTFGVSKGKWYFEGKLTVSGGTAATIGIAAEPTTSASDHLGGDAQGISIYQTSNGTFIRTGGSNTTLGDSDVVANDIIGVFIDLDNNKIYGSVNGTLETTTGISITAAASQTNGLYFPALGDYDGGQAYTWAMNFGGCPSFALSSAVSDDNGYGNFEYSPTVTVDGASTKFYALCTKNLAEYG